MKKYFVYNLILALPLGLLSYLARIHEIGSGLFALLMMLYAFFYHPIISMLRLNALGMIPKSEFWKSLIPFMSWKYSDEAIFRFKST